ncbi:hypothetical protein [Cupriavidus sp. UME77]|uniref:AMP-binding enzyme n=1 Tax=Cupriavidus sp. UME77 TaxID=1862321 RepID=UPI00351BF978
MAGAPDEQYGREFMACIVSKPGERCMQNELRSFCWNELGAYKTPRSFRIVDARPKGPSARRSG